MQTTRTRLLAAALLLALRAAPAFAANDLENAQKLWLAGQRTQAVSTIEQALKLTPDELKLRFALGVMKMELGQKDEAAALFTGLTQDFPDLADPYNNLAVIHASQGQLDLARTELEQALRLQPDNAAAQENLGDVLVRLALRAYQQAQGAQIAPSDALAAKLKRTQELIRGNTTASSR
ncbi:tetratricopeptide repeat protein [Pelomonas sp. KK5]|uniref:tetratricopeptide repeat protein n=1 Tax=Pelomonas sp. KK5 TaxID=1855730 RepID=UPI00097CA54E|nr:tetratricopeptide repeat protein [Pelomonas sp. KK5]